MSDTPKVLLAEDHPDHLYITRGLLEACGCAVVEAQDGAEAVKAAGMILAPSPKVRESQTGAHPHFW